MAQSYVQPYLFFAGRCEEALEFYRTAIGAEVEMLLRYSDSPEPMPEGRLAPGFENKVMHTSFRVGSSVLMGSDGCDVDSKFEGFSLSISLPTEAEAEHVFAELGKEGQVTMPLGPTFWSPKFGMLTDKFGIGWMISVIAEQ